MFRSAMPDYHMEIIDLLADGDLVLARFIQSGTQTGELLGIPATGKKATWGEIGILRFAGGQVVESWYNVDMLGLMQQLGVGSASAGA
jgi:predicted ester cyclase